MSVETGKKFLYISEKEITAENIEEGKWIKTKRGAQHRLHDTIPRKCDECGFPAMEISSRDFKNQSIGLGCPWCGAHREICLLCGRMEYSLREQHH